MQNCPFCKQQIEEQSFLVHEGFLAIYNIAPALPGHSLVIPKRHITSIMELSPSELQSMMVLAQKTAQLLGKIFNTEAFNWSVQQHPDAGGTLEHLHMHVLPRHSGDLPNPGDWYPLIHPKNPEEHIESSLRPRISPKDMEMIINKLRHEL